MTDLLAARTNLTKVLGAEAADAIEDLIFAILKGQHDEAAKYDKTAADTMFAPEDKLDKN